MLICSKSPFLATMTEILCFVQDIAFHIMTMRVAHAHAPWHSLVKEMTNCPGTRPRQTCKLGISLSLTGCL